MEGAIPLAPTNLTDLAFQLDHGRQRSVQSEVDSIRLQWPEACQSVQMYRRSV